MQTKHLQLWQKIEAFELDESNVQFPFSKKLAKDNCWSIPFTLLAIQEYKKFIFLSCISTIGASPSVIVDKVWHLHLTYTKSYWEDFCRKTLEKDIHHYPSKGGDNENLKHKNWYIETLVLYKKEFGKEPPTNIWPININKNIGKEEEIKFDFAINNAISGICFTIILFAFILSALFFNRINPFELNGKEFLIFFPMLTIATIIVSALILDERRKKILPFITCIFPTDYNLFEAVHFLYGKSRAVQTGLIHLFIKDIFELENNRFKYNETNTINNNVVNPLLKKALTLKDGITLSYNQIEKQLYSEDLFIHPAFFKLEQIIKLKTKLTHYLFVMVILIGVARMIQGVSNGKPVIFLFFEMAIFAVVYWVIYMNFDETSVILKESLNRIKNDGFNEIETDSGTLQQFAQNGTEALKNFNEYFVLA